MATEGVQSEIRIDSRDIGAFARVPASTGASPGFKQFWQQFLYVLATMLNTIRKNQIVLRLFWAPGDLKTSLRRIDPTKSFDRQMPGFIPWIPGLELRKVDYPGLYAAFGTSDTTDTGDAETFTLPPHGGGYLRIAGDGDTPGNTVTAIDSGSAVGGVLVSIWIKT